MSSPTSLSRRQFVKQTAIAGAGVTLFGATAPAWGSAPPSETVRVAVVGVNGRGRRLADVFARVRGSQVAAICDVDSRAVAAAQALVEEAQGKRPAGESDFRRLLEDDSIDALVIATPEHWQAPMSLLAMQAGKHVYVEKPGSHNGREGEMVAEAAAKYGRVVQTGNQRRSWPRIQEAIALVRVGEIGPVHHARSWYANARGSIGRGQQIAPPDWLDFELWQGPAPRRPFQDNLVHYNWHWFWHWGTAETGNNAIHTLDLSRWALGVDFPTRVVSAGGRYYFNDDWETPDTQTVAFEFDGGKKITWEGLSASRFGMNGTGFGLTFHGERGTILIEAGDAYRVFDVDGNEIRRVGPDPEEPARQLAGPRFVRDAAHIDNFLRCLRSGDKPASDIRDARISTTLIHLANIAHRSGRVLHCNPANGHVLDDPEAAGLWTREYEPGWEPTV
jgi:predicted dehydrogenase